MSKNIIERIWDAHLIIHKKTHPAVFLIDKMLLHEVTSAQAFDELRHRGLKVRYPKSMIATLDHSIPTTNRSSEIIAKLMKQVQYENMTFKIDLSTQKITASTKESFYSGCDPFRKECFLEGQDDLDYLLKETLWIKRLLY